MGTSRKGKKSREQVDKKSRKVGGARKNQETKNLETVDKSLEKSRNRSKKSRKSRKSRLARLSRLSLVTQLALLLDFLTY